MGGLWGRTWQQAPELSPAILPQQTLREQRDEPPPFWSKESQWSIINTKTVSTHKHQKSWSHRFWDNCMREYSVTLRPLKIHLFVATGRSANIF